MTELEKLAEAMATAQRACPYTNGGPDHSAECREATIAYAAKNKAAQDEKRGDS